MIHTTPYSPLPIILLFVSLSEFTDVSLSEVDDVNVRFVYRLHRTLAPVDPQGRGTVDPRHSHPVSGLHCIHQVMMGIEDHCVGGLAWGHVVWSGEVSV